MNKPSFEKPAVRRLRLVIQVQHGPEPKHEGGSVHGCVAPLEQIVDVLEPSAALDLKPGTLLICHHVRRFRDGFRGQASCRGGPAPVIVIVVRFTSVLRDGWTPRG